MASHHQLRDIDCVSLDTVSQLSRYHCKIFRAGRFSEKARFRPLKFF